ncbi:MAG: metallophosphoesterase, partial [Gemmobacter sp.]
MLIVRYEKDFNTMLTIIPDIHANLDLLERCLDSAAGTRPAFLGDFIDAGEKPAFTSDDRGVLHRVRALIDSGEALAVMGNHELNAILFHRRGPDGQPLRAHSDKNFKQHESFIAAVGLETPEALDWTDWFLSALPLWHE